MPGNAKLPVLAYRALYYLVPMAGGIVIYLGLERLASTETKAAETASPSDPAGIERKEEIGGALVERRAA